MKKLNRKEALVVPRKAFYSPWYNLAYQELGVKEIDGKGENPRINEYHAATKLGPKSEDIPWCASFVCWCLEKCGVKSPRSAIAKDFLDWGYELETPRIGAIVVFNRPEGGHVGIFVAEENGRVLILGGNQKNAVTMEWFGKSKILGFRWPYQEESPQETA